LNTPKKGAGQTDSVQKEARVRFRKGMALSRGERKKRKL